MDQSLTLTMRAFGILLLHGRDNCHGAMASLTPYPTKEAALQHRRIEPIRFSSPMFAGYGHAGGVDDMRIYAAFPQPASQPEAIAPSLVRHGNPGDRPSGLNCFVPPAMQQFQQVFRVRLQFLQRFSANARYQSGDQPA